MKRVYGLMLLLCLYTLFLNACSGTQADSLLNGAQNNDTTDAGVTVVPANGTGKVLRNSEIMATFTKTLDCATVAATSFTLKESATGTAITVDITCSGDTAKFAPVSSVTDMKHATSYTATLTTGIKDSSGNAMLSSNYTWSFTTKSKTAALKADGNLIIAMDDDNKTVWTWGDDDDALGRGASANWQSPPGIVTFGSTTFISAIDAGGDSGFAAMKDGTVWSWGYNLWGSLGDGTQTDRNTPVPVLMPALPQGVYITQIAAGAKHVLALRSDGNVMAWGKNDNGQLGDGTTTQRLTPVQVKDPNDSTGFLTNVVAVAAYSYTSDYSLALKSDGTVWAWGNNDYGQLGQGGDEASGYSPSPSVSVSPLQVKSRSGGFLSGVKAISAGERAAVVVKSDGTVWAWGDNIAGRLGDGAVCDHWKFTPVQVVGPNGSGFLTNVVAVSSASQGFSVMALKDDGTVWGWGADEDGQLGDGTTGISYTCPNTTLNNLRPYPVQASGLADIISIETSGANGNSHTVALKSDGTVWAWGRNSNNTLGLGNGSADPTLVPAQVPGF